MSDQKDLITFEQALPIISQSLDSLIFAGLKTSIPNLYRSFSDFVRHQSEDLNPVSFVSFITWFMEKPYYFKFDDEGSLKAVFRRLSDNPEYDNIKRFIQFYIVWQLDLEHPNKSPLGIYFAPDNMLNDLEKVNSFKKQFNLKEDWEFYDKDENGVLILNKGRYPFLSQDSTDILKEILESDWKLFGSLPNNDNEFWNLLRSHLSLHKKTK